MSNKYEVQFVDSLSDDVKELVKEVLETSINFIFDNEIISRIPFISYISTIYEITESHSDRIMKRKLLVFLNTITDSSREERAKFKEQFYKNAKTFNKSIDYLIVILDQLNEIDKARLIGYIFISALEGKINDKELRLYSQIVSSLFYDDLEVLSKGNYKIINNDNIDEAYLRLSALGLMKEHVGLHHYEMQFTNGDLSYDSCVDDDDHYYLITPLGSKFLSIVTLKE